MFYFMILLPLMFVTASANAQDNTSVGKYETNGLVYFEDVEGFDCSSNKRECYNKKNDVISAIPGIESYDYNKDNNSVILRIADKRITTPAVIKSAVNKSNIMKVKKVLIPAPKAKIVLDDPYKGKSQADIKKAYDDYYRENPDLKPKNWEFSN